VREVGILMIMERMKFGKDKRDKEDMSVVYLAG